MDWSRYHLPPDTIALLEQSPCVTVAGCVSELVEAACGGPGSDYYEVAYDVPGKGRVVEATVARVRNGVAVNYTDPYMRRRDPDSMGFMPQWIAREYLARRCSARFKPDQLKPARCSLLGCEDRIGIWYRPGGHAQGLDDWRALLDFADWQLLGKAPARRFDLNLFA